MCPHDGTPMIKKTHKEVIKHLQKISQGIRIGICAQVRSTFESPKEFHDFVGQKGFVRYIVDNVVYSLSDALPEAIKDAWILVDRVELDHTDSTQLDRISQSITTAFEHGEDVVGIYQFEEKKKEKMTVFSRAFRCPQCGYVPEELTLSHFSFNSPTGACPTCHGLGSLLSFTEESVIDSHRSVEDGCVLPWSPDSYYHFVLDGVCRHHRIPVDIPYQKLSDKQKKIILHGSEDRLSLSTPQMHKPWNARYPGIIPYLNRVYHDPETSEALHEKIDPFVVSTLCPTCHGFRVGEAARNTIIVGHIDTLTY